MAQQLRGMQEGRGSLLVCKIAHERGSGQEGLMAHGVPLRSKQWWWCPWLAGFTGDGKTCEDVDECKAGTAECQQTCTNTLGGYECSCRPGFQLVSWRPLIPHCAPPINHSMQRTSPCKKCLSLACSTHIREE